MYGYLNNGLLLVGSNSSKVVVQPAANTHNWCGTKTSFVQIPSHKGNWFLVIVIYNKTFME